MKDLLILLIHLLTTIAKLLEPGRARAVVADSQFVRNSRCCWAPQGASFNSCLSLLTAFRLFSKAPPTPCCRYC